MFQIKKIGWKSFLCLQHTRLVCQTTNLQYVQYVYTRNNRNIDDYFGHLENAEPHHIHTHTRFDRHDVTPNNKCYNFPCHKLCSQSKLHSVVRIEKDRQNDLIDVNCKCNRVLLHFIQRFRWWCDVMWCALIVYVKKIGIHSSFGWILVFIKKNFFDHCWSNNNVHLTRCHNHNQCRINQCLRVAFNDNRY